MVYNKSFVDAWTGVHVTTGFILGLLELKRKYAYSLIVGSEVVENVLLRKTFSGFFEESLVNIVSDIIFCSLGYEFSREFFK